MITNRSCRSLLRAVLLGALVMSAGCGPSVTTATRVREVLGGFQELREVPTRSTDRAPSVVYVADGLAGPVGYAVESRVASRSGPFRILVIMDAALRVKQATVVSYPNAKGRKVQSPAFTGQFEGKGPGDPIRLGKDIHAMTGATMSSRAMTDGVRRSVRLAQEEAARQ